ncbi:7-carboxy-7-deazaguanine synthase QueE [Priestia aryabhattai]|uniref:7-carboxy-7-deazaguanine synthase QueE n=1 Tax=Priestia aryabhattai TaxID=412384 RepID=UPI002E1BD980|nr:7-carboxy-7-deazaguanine synthase QueE [Priestia aryabhattai]MED4013274.1 7-carboxy-7-deazaguanine synthase QueE [Priestia aryabhattai]
MTNRIPVLEIFGPTIQGEGMVAGQKTIFIRTFGCDYRCSWCDSKFTWDGTQKPILMSPEDILQKVSLLSNGTCNHVTISGGNPALISSLDVLLDLLQLEGFSVGLETQGSKWQDWFLKIQDLTISPKPPSSNMKTDVKTLENIILKLKENKINYSIKVVIFNDEDFTYAKKLHWRFPSPSHKWFLQVGNDDTNSKDNLAISLLEKYEWLCNKVIADKSMLSVRPLPQLHTLLWGNKQGV